MSVRLPTEVTALSAPAKWKPRNPRGSLIGTRDPSELRNSAATGAFPPCGSGSVIHARRRPSGDSWRPPPGAPCAVHSTAPVETSYALIVSVPVSGRGPAPVEKPGGGGGACATNNHRPSLDAASPSTNPLMVRSFRKVRAS